MKKVHLTMIILWSLIGLAILSVMVWSMLFDSGSSRSRGADGRNAKLLVDESIPAKELESIQISLASDMCRVYLTDGDNVLIKHYGRNLSDDRLVKASQQNGSLTVSTMNFSTFHFDFFTWSNYSLVEIYLPKSYKEKLNVNISSGTLTLEDALDLSELGVKLSSGTFRSEYGVKAPVANIGVTSGTIRMSGGLIADEYDIGVSSGTIGIDGLSGSGNVGATSGTIRLSGVDIKDYLNVETSSGTIHIGITGNPPLQFTGQKSSGTIRTYFGDFGGGKNFSATTGEAPYKKLDVRVTSGTIRITND